jgi:two-component system, NarL family, response regulator DegU
MLRPKNIATLIQLMRGEGFSPAKGLAQKIHSAGDHDFEIMQKLRVLIVDDMALMRQGIKSLLEKRGNIEFVGEGSSGHEATHLAESLAPDVILLDQDMPGLDSVEAIKFIKQCVPKTEIIVLAEETDFEKSFRSLEAGATGYVLKDISPDNLARAIEGVCNDKTLMHPQVARQLVERFRILSREKNGKDGLHLGGLTSRELQILLEMTRGATDKEIAQKTHVSTTTVKSHIRSIFRKIGARNRTQAVVYVLKGGLSH